MKLMIKNLYSTWADISIIYYDISLFFLIFLNILTVDLFLKK